ncbi:MAG: tetratricopeptide repeat protein, partial [Pseudomonadota bacterium]
DAIAYNNRGFAYGKLGNHQQAIKDYNKAIDLDPLDAMAYSNRGFAYGILGNYQQGIEDIKVVARLGDGWSQDFLRSKDIVW